ncbi:maternal B9.15 protein-like [Corythoichthys intestinalis]|uniref:maternal B9.15 protein-like n=1 Tax=Corythoichthys intestinalis TaxID=161448 RepID=UPI0025A5AD4A|nr:maternal B9.15 protein-like [Corythoichthys intestinalis]XP_061801345.1 maternal B9.15 protein-like [Nerophis lumbriciformis]
MKEEIAAAVFFMTRLVKRYGSLNNDGRECFAAALTSALLECYKNHWYPNMPTKGQAYRCLRMNRMQPEDPVVQKACERSGVCYEDLGLPREFTVWVDPGEVSCRYGEHGSPFCVSLLDARRRSDGKFTRRVHDAVERAGLDVPEDSSSDHDDDDNDDEKEDCCNGNGSLSPLCTEPRTIPTVSNPNSVYRFSEFASGAPQTWLTYPMRKPFGGDVFLPHAPLPPPAPQQLTATKGFNSYRATFTFTGPRVDKYHWVSKSRS